MPAKDTTNNLDGTLSGGRFSVTLDNTSTPRLMDLSGTVFALVEVTAPMGPPKLTARVLTTTPRSSTGQVTVSLQITNSGTGPAKNVSIDQVALRTLTGTGTVTPATALPIAVGDIAAGQSKTATMTVNVPTSVLRFSMTENGRYTDDAGTMFSLSMAQAIAPQ